MSTILHYSTRIVDPKEKLGKYFNSSFQLVQRVLHLNGVNVGYEITAQ